MKTERTPLPSDWMVRDDHGRVWPPGFVPQLTDPTSRFAVVTNRTRGASERSTAHRNEAIAAGEDWAKGSVVQLGGRVAGQGNPNGRPRAFAFSPVNGAPSPAEVVWRHLQGLPAGEIRSDAELGLLLGLKGCDLRVRLKAAVGAGVLVAERVGSGVSYSLGTTVPAGAEA